MYVVCKKRRQDTRVQRKEREVEEEKVKDRAARKGGEGIRGNVGREINARW